MYTLQERGWKSRNLSIKLLSIFSLFTQFLFVWTKSVYSQFTLLINLNKLLPTKIYELKIFISQKPLNYLLYKVKIMEFYDYYQDCAYLKVSFFGICLLYHNNDNDIGNLCNMLIELFLEQIFCKTVLLMKTGISWNFGKINFFMTNIEESIYKMIEIYLQH